jgi:hypothetical protein
MEYTKFTYRRLFELAETSELVLPNFQRKFVWKPDQQKQLLASFLVNLPIGTFLILEGEGGEFVSRKLCFKKGDFYTNSECFYLLDGQQRLSSLKNIFSDHLSTAAWESTIESLHYSLSNKWFLDINIRENGEDILGLNDLKFKIESKNKFETYEPSDLIDNIVSYQIYKTKNTDKFYHPDASKGEGEYDAKLDLASECANRKLLPLFDLLSEDRVVLKTTLKVISDLKLQSLKELVGSDFSLASKYLGHLDPDIEEKYRKNKHDQYNIRWESLKEQWIDDILDYFKDLFKVEIIIPTVKSKELARATSVFEYMNKGGTPLDSFDILIAKYAGIGDTYTLYTKLEDSLKGNLEIHCDLSETSEPIEYSPISIGLFSNDTIIKPLKEQFLNLLSLNRKISESGLDSVSLSDIKRSAHLSLNRKAIDGQIDKSLLGLNRAISFLQFRCGIDNFNRFSYRLMILPLALVLSEDDNWNNRNILGKLEFWYWSSLFSGKYREKQNQRVIEDIKLLKKWISGNKELELTNRIEKVFKDQNYSDFATLVFEGDDKVVPKAIRDGLLSYVLSNIPNDFIEVENKLKAWEVFQSNTSLQDHHIVPLGSVSKLGESTKELRKIKDHILNSPLNRVLISNSANNTIRAMNINRYMPVLNKSVEFSQFVPKDLPSENELNSGNTESYQIFLKSRFELISTALKRELSAFLN